MSKKTVLRFSKRILSQLPGIAMNAYNASGGDVCAWIHTGERVLGAISDTVVMCIHHSTIKKLTEEVETAKQTMQKQVDTAEKAAAEQCCQKLNSIREKLKKERESLEKYLQAEQQKTEQMRREKVSMNDIDAQIKLEKDARIRNLQEEARAKTQLVAATGRKTRSKVELEIAQQEAISKTEQIVRKHLKNAIDLFDEKLQSNPLLMMLSQEERLRLDEQRRILQWQYTKQIHI